MIYKSTDRASVRAAPERTRVRAPERRTRREPLAAPADLYRLTPEAISALQRSVGNRGLGQALQRQHPSLVGSEVAILRSSESPPPPNPDEPVLERYRGQSVNKVGQVSAPANQYQIAKTTGVNVRARPDGTLPSIGKVVYGTDAQCGVRLDLDLVEERTFDSGLIYARYRTRCSRAPTSGGSRAT